MGCYYVDKTAFILRLIEQGKYYFLSRPRRFGKSLLLDTLAELFAGNQALFQGLYAHDRWDWDIRYPVIRISFGGGVVQDPDQLTRKIREQLRINQAALGVTCSEPDIEGCFAELIREAHAATGQRVVVLVDEYDKPILDNLTRPETAKGIRDGLRNLYSVIKDSDAHIRFAMLTGVSKFSKVSLFSGLNNLNDITVDRQVFRHLRLHRSGPRSGLRPDWTAWTATTLTRNLKLGKTPAKGAISQANAPEFSHPMRPPSQPLAVLSRRLWISERSRGAEPEPRLSATTADRSDEHAKSRTARYQPDRTHGCDEHRRRVADRRRPQLSRLARSARISSSAIIELVSSARLARSEAAVRGTPG